MLYVPSDGVTLIAGVTLIFTWGNFDTYLKHIAYYINFAFSIEYQKHNCYLQYQLNDA